MEKNTNNVLNNSSDDEVYFGKLSLKEIKKRVLWKKHEFDICPNIKSEDADNENSLKIIETHSEPNLVWKYTNPSTPQLTASSNPCLSPDSSPTPAWGIKASDESFLKMEKMVSDQCVSPNEFDNTLDVIDYILKNGPSQSYENYNTNSEVKKYEFNHNPITKVNTVLKNEVKEENKSAIKEKNLQTCTTFVTPVKNKMQFPNDDKYATPCSDVKTPIFKTPGHPVSHKKTPGSLLKRTPSKIKSYEHIASPVASYINNCPVVPLLKDVRPTKPLPGPSAIPKFVKSTQSKFSNKENVALPTIAYKSAKKTKVIEVPDDDKLPQSQWAKKITSSLPKPLVMKHDHREMNLARRCLMSKQEDSIADLSLQQADLSVCTQKSAFNKPKKRV